MPWIQLTKDTYYYPGTTNVGYHNGVIIDAGESVPAAEKMALELEEMGLEIRWLLNTHGHPDHCGGNAGFIKHGAKLVACDFQTSYMMNLQLASHFMYGAEVVFGEKRPFKYPDAEPVYPDMTVRPGKIELDGMEFILDRRCGHALDQITILTPDNVLFIGDILMPEVLIKRTTMPTMFSAIKQMEDFDHLRGTDHAFYVPGHGKILSSPSELIDANEKLHFKFINEIYGCCQEPKTREEIAAHLIRKYRLARTMSGTNVVINTVGSYIMYLESEDKISSFCKNGFTYFASL